MSNEEDVVLYDVEEAAAEVAKRTEVDLVQVEEILEAEFFFNAALGFYEIPDDDEGEEFLEEVRKVMADHADLIPPADTNLDDYDDIEERLVAFIARVTEIDEPTIEKVLDEHILYLEEQGILEPVDE